MTLSEGQRVKCLNNKSMNTGEFRSEKACYSACMSGVYDKLDSTQDVFQSISKRIPTLTLVQGQMCRKTISLAFDTPSASVAQSNHKVIAHCF